MEREQIYRITNSGKIIPVGELVRCKDCRYSLPSSENIILCTAPCESQYPKAYKPIDWFCAGGERKDGDGDIEPVCVNCKNDYHETDGCKAEPCRTCSNGWKGENFTENHFEPKDDLRSDQIGD